MQNKRNTGGSKALRVLAVIIGALMILVGMLSASGDMDKILEGIGVGGGLLSFAKTMEKLPVWNNTTLALVGLLLIGGVLNGIDVKKRDNAALNSKLIRRPVQRLYLVFLAPTFAAFCLGFLYPFVKGIFLSFCRFKTTSKWTWVGFDNYVSAFNDPSFLHAFWYTAIFAVTSLILINVLSFAVAYALTRGIRGTNIFRTVFFMPNLIGGIVLGYIWAMIFDGVLSRYGTSILLKSQYGYWGLQILMAWQQIGYMMIIYIAGLQAVPEDILEAARIDGANAWQTLWKVTIPNVMPSITICTFLTLTNSFKLFDQNLALTAGRPFIQNAGETVKTTEMLALNIYSSFYASTTNRGVGQAKAVIFFVLVAAISILQLSSSRKKEVQHRRDKQF
jgi:raffinose/stachyose/melibiose transport system permease protein